MSRTASGMAALPPRGSVASRPSVSSIGDGRLSMLPRQSLGEASESAASSGTSPARGSNSVLSALSQKDARATVLASQMCNISTATPEEHDTFELIRLLMLEYERKYDVDALGLDKIHKNRRWHTQHYKHFQHTLLRSRALRVLSATLAWLESTAPDQKDAFFGVAGDKSKVSTEHHYRGAFWKLRAGKVDEALQIARAGDEGYLAVLLSTSKLQIEEEHCFKGTALCPLFGEYVNTPELDPPHRNEQRLNLLAGLYDNCSDALNGQATSFELYDRAIDGLLSGHRGAMMAAFGDRPSWQDALWVELRSAILMVFHATLRQAGHKIDSVALTTQVTALSSGRVDGNWLEEAETQIVSRVSQILRNWLDSKQMTPSGEAQVRCILTALVRPEAPELAFSATPMSVWSHCAILRILSAAKTDQLLPINVQLSPAYAEGLGHFVTSVITDPQIPHSQISKQLGSQLLDCLATINDQSRRAKEYAACISLFRSRLHSGGCTKKDLEALESFLMDVVRNNEAEREAVVSETLKHLANRSRGKDATTRITHDARSESVLWLSMATEPKQVIHAAHQAISTASTLWMEKCDDALRDVRDIMLTRIQPKLAKATGDSDEAKETLQSFEFWDAVVRLCDATEEHRVLCEELQASTAKLAKKGQQQPQARSAHMVQLDSSTSAAISEAHLAMQSVTAHTSPSVVQTAGATLQRLASSVALHILTTTHDQEAEYELQRLFKQLEPFMQRHDVEQGLSQGDAGVLLDSMRRARGALGSRKHDQMVAMARAQAAAAAFGAP